MTIRTSATPESRRAASQHAAAVRDHGADSPEATFARNNWQAERFIALFIALAEESTPTFTADQRQRLADVVARIPILQEVSLPAGRSSRVPDVAEVLAEAERLAGAEASR